MSCFGAKRGKQETFTLLDEWVAPTQPIPREEALAKLAQRYFASHGPATVHDLARWAGITVTDARHGTADVGTALICEIVAGTEYWLPQQTPEGLSTIHTVHLLPGFDEYILGYSDRDAVLAPQHADRICPGGNGVFRPTVVIDGIVRGTWQRTLKKKGVAIEWTPFEAFSAAESTAIAAAAQRYGEFLTLPVIAH